jgi:hypothetical protein
LERVATDRLTSPCWRAAGPGRHAARRCARAAAGG